MKETFLEDCKERIFNELIDWDEFVFDDIADFGSYVEDQVDYSINEDLKSVGDVEEVGRMYSQEIDLFWERYNDMFEWEIENNVSPFNDQFRHDIIVCMIDKGCKTHAEDILFQMLHKNQISEVNIEVNDGFLLTFCKALDDYNIHPFSRLDKSLAKINDVRRESFLSRALKEIEKRSVNIHSRPIHTTPRKFKVGNNSKERRSTKRFKH